MIFCGGRGETNAMERIGEVILVEMNARQDDDDDDEEEDGARGKG